VVTGGQNLNDTALEQGLPPSDPFWGMGLCAPYALPHCHHHGDQGADPYPAEGQPGCEAQVSPAEGPKACDASASGGAHGSFDEDKYSFDGRVVFFPSDAETIMAALMRDGPVAAAFDVYADFETYAGGVYQRTAGHAYEGGHAVRIVGWGTTEAGVDYWTVANSWNPYWGEQGYFRILRGVDECGIESSVVASEPGASWHKNERAFD